jgi:hypothetical protein
MTQIDPASALLERVRSHELLTQDRAASIVADLETRAAAGDPGPTLAETGATGMNLVGKLLIGLALGAGVGVPAFLLWGSDAEAPVPAAPAAVLAPALEKKVEPPPLSPVPAEPSAPAVVSEVEPPAAPPPAKRGPAPKVEAATQESPSDPRAEIALIRKAQAALSAGDSARALALLDQHAREFSAGILVEERKVSHAQALCIAGRRAEALREVTAFLKTYPQSVLRERARRICENDPTDPG